MVKLLLFWFRITNWMVELLFSHVRVTKIWKISNYIWITDLKTEKKNKKTKCWSIIIVIRDFVIEMIYYTIQNIWKKIGKINFVIIDVDLGLKRYRLDLDITRHMDTSFYYPFFVFGLLCCKLIGDIYLSMLGWRVP